MTLAEWEDYEFEQGAAQQCAPAPAAAEELERRLAETEAELHRCQTRLFAYERAMLALKRENAELEAKCRKARELSESLSALWGDDAVPRKAQVLPKQPITFAGAELYEYPVQKLHTPQPEPEAEPKTELQYLADEILDMFDAWLEQG